MYIRCCVEENESSYEQGENCFRLRNVLGINWVIKKVLFVFDFDEIIQLVKFNFMKRNLSKINAIFFDSLGLILPMALQGKRLFKVQCLDKRIERYH